jgi:hypothetical protein
MMKKDMKEKPPEVLLEGEKPQDRTTRVFSLFDRGYERTTRGKEYPQRKNPKKHF